MLLAIYCKTPSRNNLSIIKNKIVEWTDPFLIVQTTHNHEDYNNYEEAT